MTVTITIECNNAAFGDQPELEVARILRKQADDMEHSGRLRVFNKLYDINGNAVGSIELGDE